MNQTERLSALQERYNKRRDELQQAEGKLAAVEERIGELGLKPADLGKEIETIRAEVLEDERNLERELNAIESLLDGNEPEEGPSESVAGADAGNGDGIRSRRSRRGVGG